MIVSTHPLFRIAALLVVVGGSGVGVFGLAVARSETPQIRVMRGAARPRLVSARRPILPIPVKVSEAAKLAHPILPTLPAPSESDNELSPRIPVRDAPLDPAPAVPTESPQLPTETVIRFFPAESTGPVDPIEPSTPRDGVYLEEPTNGTSQIDERDVEVSADIEVPADAEVPANLEVPRVEIAPDFTDLRSDSTATDSLSDLAEEALAPPQVSGAETEPDSLVEAEHNTDGEFANAQINKDWRKEATGIASLPAVTDADEEQRHATPDANQSEPAAAPTLIHLVRDEAVPTNPVLLTLLGAFVGGCLVISGRRLTERQHSPESVLRVKIVSSDVALLSNPAAPPPRTDADPLKRSESNTPSIEDFADGPTLVLPMNSTWDQRQRDQQAQLLEIERGMMRTIFEANSLLQKQLSA